MLDCIERFASRKGLTLTGKGRDFKSECKSLISFLIILLNISLCCVRLSENIFTKIERRGKGF